MRLSRHRFKIAHDGSYFYRKCHYDRNGRHHAREHFLKNKNMHKYILYVMILGLGLFAGWLIFGGEQNAAMHSSDDHTAEEHGSFSHNHDAAGGPVMDLLDAPPKLCCPNSTTALSAEWTLFP